MSPRMRSAMVVLSFLAACRNGEGVVQAPVTPTPAPASPVAAAPSEPVSSSSGGSGGPGSELPGPALVEPTPPVEDLRDGQFVRVAGRRVVVSTIEEEPTPERLAADEDAMSTYALEVSIDGATEGDGAFTLPVDFEWCDTHEAVVEPVNGAPSPLVFAQAFCESGEDEFSRDLWSVVIHVGDASTAPRILWKGGGSYGSSFGVCESIDVPSASIVRPGVVRIEQHTEVVKHADPDRIRPPCRPKKARVQTKAEIEF